MRKREFFIESEEVCNCPKCQSLLTYRDKVIRKQKLLNGEQEIYKINRMQCTNENCRTLHRQLPDFMVAYKQYTAEAIEDVLDGVISEEDGLDKPCENTMKNWRKWFAGMRQQAEGQIHSAGYRLLDFSTEFLNSCESLLEGLRERISPGWLGMVGRLVYNTGGTLLICA